MSDAEKPKVAFELVPPATRFQCSSYDGSEVVIEGLYVTDDPRLISELDAQNHALRRTTVPAAKSKS